MPVSMIKILLKEGSKLRLYSRSSFPKTFQERLILGSKGVGGKVLDHSL